MRKIMGHLQLIEFKVLFKSQNIYLHTYLSGVPRHKKSKDARVRDTHKGMSCV